MRIGIMGTRGIPNQYGGFEQFAEFVAPALVANGHEVYVYNSSRHPYRENSWKGVNLISKKDPEDKLGSFGQFLYDLSCVLDARKRNYDILLQLGYTSSSIWGFLFPKKCIIITNMDGLEWKRSKYSPPVQRFLKKAEKWAAFHSDELIADSKGIQSYLRDKYGKDSTYIAYGAVVFENPDEEQMTRLGYPKYQYHLLIARMEPENNIECILEGFRNSRTQKKLLLIGNYQNKFGSYLKNKYEDERTKFLGPIYDLGLLNNLRYFSSLYFHGHSVGGTNPSLLEAMASHCLIAAHDNIFNRAVLEEDAFYFNRPEDITRLLDQEINKNDQQLKLENNRKKIESAYSWHQIVNQIEALFTKAIHEPRTKSPS